MSKTCFVPLVSVAVVDEFKHYGYTHMGVSKNSGTPKSSILIGFSIIFTIHLGVPLFLETVISLHDRIIKSCHLSMS